VSAQTAFPLSVQSKGAHSLCWVLTKLSFLYCPLNPRNARRVYVILGFTMERSPEHQIFCCQYRCFVVRLAQSSRLVLFSASGAHVKVRSLRSLLAQDRTEMCPSYKKPLREQSPRGFLLRDAFRQCSVLCLINLLLTICFCNVFV